MAKNNSISASIQSLTALAHDVHNYTKQLTYSGSLQRQQAEQLMFIIDKALATNNEQWITALFQNSIVPKLEKLAKELSLFNIATTKPNKQQQRSRTPHHHGATMQAPSHAPYTSTTTNCQQYDDLPTAQQEHVDNTIAQLMELLTK